MGKIEELASIVTKIRAELASFQTGYLADLATEIADYVYKNDDVDEDLGLLDAASTLGSLLEDTVACFEDSIVALQEMEDLLSKLR